MNPATRAGRAPQAGRRTRTLWSVPAPELPCRAEPELFFAEDPRDLARARELCGGCPMRVACLAGALQRGVIIADKRARGRPRKEDVAV
jgi:WhiB family redox-sensing transcriptional regulator